MLISALIVRRQYGRALISLLEQEDYLALLSSDALPEGATDLAADPATIGKLKEKLMTSQSPEFTIFMARLISEVSGNEATPVLAEAVRNAATRRVRAALIDLVAETGTARIGPGKSGDVARSLYVEHLADPDAGVRLAALDGLTQDADDRSLPERALPLLDDPDIEVRARAIAALLQSSDDRSAATRRAGGRSAAGRRRPAYARAGRPPVGL